MDTTDPPYALVSILIEVKPASQTNLPRIFSALRRLSGCIARRLASMGKRSDTGDHGSINGYTHGEKIPTLTDAQDQQHHLSLPHAG